MIAFFVPGKPAPQGSKSFKGMRGGRPILVESSKTVAPWRQAVATHARALRRPMLHGPITVRLDFVLPRPVATPKTRPTPPAVKYPDLDKLARACFDALSNICFENDSQVTDLVASKRIAEVGETTGVHITVETANGQGILDA